MTKIKVISIIELPVGGVQEGAFLEQNPERVQPVGRRLSAQACGLQLPLGALYVNNLIITPTSQGQPLL